MKQQTITPETKIMLFLTAIFVATAAVLICLTSFGFDWYKGSVNNLLQDLRGESATVNDFNNFIKQTTCSIAISDEDFYPNPSAEKAEKKSAHVLSCTVNNGITNVGAESLLKMEEKLSTFKIVSGKVLKIRSGKVTITAENGDTLTVEQLKNSKQV